MPNLSHVEHIESPLHCLSPTLQVDALGVLPRSPGVDTANVHSYSCLKSCPGRGAWGVFPWKFPGGSASSPRTAHSQDCPIMRHKGIGLKLDHISTCFPHAFTGVTSEHSLRKLLAQKANLRLSFGQPDLRYLQATALPTASRKVFTISACFCHFPSSKASLPPIGQAPQHGSESHRPGAA